MNFIETIIQRNEEFGHSATLKIIPSTKTIIIDCLDPRVDPMDILGLKPGEAANYRNIGGRINPAVVATMILLPNRYEGRGYGRRRLQGQQGYSRRVYDFGTCL